MLGGRRSHRKANVNSKKYQMNDEKGKMISPPTDNKFGTDALADRRTENRACPHWGVNPCLLWWKTLLLHLTQTRSLSYRVAIERFNEMLVHEIYAWFPTLALPPSIYHFHSPFSRGSLTALFIHFPPLHSSTLLLPPPILPRLSFERFSVVSIRIKRVQ